MIYGYCRISRKTQNIERQIRNIKASYPDAVIIQEAFTGTTTQRPKWKQLLKKIEPGDIIVFDSVSRMSRNADDGYLEYEALYTKGVELVFLKEPVINTSTFRYALSKTIPTTGTNVDLILDGVNAFLLELAKEQIRLTFGQAEKEVLDLRQRTKEGMETAKLAGKHVGIEKGRKLVTKKSIKAKKIMQKHSKYFGGSLNDKECAKIAGISMNTFYKYRRELLENPIVGVDPAQISLYDAD